MTKQELKALYDEISTVVDNFEEVDPGYMVPDDDVVYPMYDTLCKVLSHWDEITNTKNDS